MSFRLIQEFKPTLLFLGKFVALYFIGNLLYGLYVTSYEPHPDPVTNLVTRQTSWTLNSLNWENEIEDNLTRPSTFIIYGGHRILSVYEGCNGLNVMIIFAAFIVAFGPITKTILWFIPMGLVIIHLFNLIRILLLFFVSLEFPDFLYIVHKYIFTGIIFFIVFLLWIGWVKFYALKARK